MTWPELVQKFCDDQGGNWDDKTLKWYMARLKVFSAFADDRLALGSLTAADLNRFNGHIKRLGLKWSTRQGTRTALKAFARWLYRRKYLPANPFDDPDYKPPRKERQVKRAIPLSYAQRMIQQAERDGSLGGIRDAAIMRLLLTTGLRREEVTGLKLGDVDLDTGELTIMGKFDHQRPGYLRLTTLNAMKRWWAVRPETNDPTLFVSLQPNKKGLHHQMRPDALNDLLIKWRDRAGLPPVSVSPHKWRRRFATELAKAQNPFGLQLLMGHSDIATTSGYVVGEPDTLRRLIDEYAPDADEEGQDQLPF